MHQILLTLNRFTRFRYVSNDAVVTQVTRSLFSKWQVQNYVELATGILMGNDDPMKQTIMIGILPVKRTLSRESIKQPLTFDVVLAQFIVTSYISAMAIKVHCKMSFVHPNASQPNETESSGRKTSNRSVKRNDETMTETQWGEEKRERERNSINMEYAMKIVAQICLHIVKWRTLANRWTAASSTMMVKTFVRMKSCSQFIMRCMSIKSLFYRQ